MKAGTAQLFAKAAESLEDARILFDAGRPSAAGRAYYAMLHSAQALLFEHGMSFRRHSAVIGRFGQLVAGTAVDVKFHRWLIDAHRERQETEYGLRYSLTRQKPARRSHAPTNS